MKCRRADRIGVSLVQMGAMTPDQVDSVLKGQSDDIRCFGEITLELGSIEDNAIKRHIGFREKGGIG